MTKPAVGWLAAYVAAATFAFAPLRVVAEEPRPDKAIKPPAAESVEPPPPARDAKRDTYPFRGVVGSFDAAEQALTLEGKTSKRRVHLTRQTRLTRDGQPAGVEELKPGEEVGGTLRRSPEGREEAVLIRIGPKPDDASKAGSSGKATTPREEKEPETPKSE